MNCAECLCFSSSLDDCALDMDAQTAMPPDPRSLISRLGWFNDQLRPLRAQLPRRRLPSVLMRLPLLWMAADIIAGNNEFQHLRHLPDSRVTALRQVFDRSEDLQHATFPLRQRFRESRATLATALVAELLLIRLIDWYATPLARSGWHRSDGDWPHRLLVAANSVLDAIRERFGDIGRWSIPICAACLVIALLITLVANFQRTVSRWSTYHAALKVRLLPLVRMALSEFAHTEHEDQLTVTNAPGLSADTTLDRHVDQPAGERLRTLITQLGASAVAISGPRGCGKTTLLRGEADQQYRLPTSTPDSLRVMVRAPVSYEPRDFVIHLYSQLCSTVLDASQPWRRPRRADTHHPVRWIQRLVSLAIAAAVLVLLVQRLSPTSRSPADIDTNDTLFILILLMGGLALNWIVGLVLTPPSGGPIDPFGADLAKIAADAEQRLRRLRYLQVLSAEAAVGVSRLGVTMGSRRTRQLAEQVLTLPELTSECRDLLGSIAQLWERRDINPAVVIGIDEVDRIADPADVERFLNGIKAMFDVPGCRYLVTVSEEALAHLERSVTEVKDVLDSTFDEIVRLEPFSLRQAERLLQQRVAGFPQRLVDLCYVLSGGLPRDLVRTARLTVRLANETGTTEVNELAELVIDAEARKLKTGSIWRVLSSLPSTPSSDITSLMIDDAWPHVDDLLNAAVIFSRVKHDDRICTKLSAAFFFYATVSDVINGRLPERDYNTYLKVIAALARARNRLAEHPEFTMAVLTSMRSDLGLSC